MLRGLRDGRTYHIGPAVHFRKHTSRIRGWYLKVRNNGNGFDLLGPFKLVVEANSQRRVRRTFTSIDATSRRRQDLAEGNLYSRDIFGLELIQIRPNKASEERRSNVIRVSLC